MTRPNGSGIAGLALLLVIATARVCDAQMTAWPLAPGAQSTPATTSDRSDLRFEVTVGGGIGYPIGNFKAGETGAPGTRRALGDFGIDLSENLEGSLAFAITPRDAIRASLQYYFLDGSTTTHRSVVYNVHEFAPGRLHLDADFYRVDLAYERTFLSDPSSEQLVGSAGLALVNVGQTVTGRGASNTEIFSGITSRRLLPVPILGLRWDYPLRPGLILRTSVSGGGLPKVDSLRSEAGGTLSFEQIHTDASLGLVYMLNRHVQLETCYHFTYFYQYSTSAEDKNLFEFIDDGLRLGVIFRF